MGMGHDIGNWQLCQFTARFTSLCGVDGAPCLPVSQAQRSWSRRDMTLSPRCDRSHRKIIGTLTHQYGGGSRCNRPNRQDLAFTTDTRGRLPHSKLRRGTENCPPSFISTASNSSVRISHIRHSAAPNCAIRIHPTLCDGQFDC